MTGADRLDGKALDIMRAIGTADHPLMAGEISEAVGMHTTSVAHHIRWNLLHRWVKVAKTSTDRRNGHTIKHYGLTAEGEAKLEAML